MVKITEVKELAKIKVGEVVEYNGDKIKVAGPEENKKRNPVAIFAHLTQKMDVLLLAIQTKEMIKQMFTFR